MAMVMVNSTFGEGVERLYKGFRHREVDVDALQALVMLHKQVNNTKKTPPPPKPTGIATEDISEAATSSMAEVMGAVAMHIITTTHNR